jgi:hypothetical protein
VSLRTGGDELQSPGVLVGSAIQIRTARVRAWLRRGRASCSFTARRRSPCAPTTPRARQVSHASRPSLRSAKGRHHRNCPLAAQRWISLLDSIICLARAARATATLGAKAAPRRSRAGEWSALAPRAASPRAHAPKAFRRVSPAHVPHAPPNASMAYAMPTENAGACVLFVVNFAAQAARGLVVGRNLWLRISSPGERCLNGAGEGEICPCLAGAYLRQTSSRVQPRW